ncbi:MAG: cell envelope integrity protein CreD [Burkholderiaceae bacterium]
MSVPNPLPDPLAAGVARVRAARFPILGKTIAVGLVLFALMLALQSVTAIVNERESRLHEAERSVADSLASQQIVLGPMLQRSCVESWNVLQGEGKEQKTVTERREFTLGALPESLDVSAKAALEPRYRGIFKVNGYAMKSTLAARWANLDSLKPVAQHAGSKLQCDAPVMFVAIGDARGIRNAAITVAGNPLPVLPGTEHASHPRGFHAELPNALVESGAPVAATVALDLVGTGELGFAPIAGATKVELTSDWPHPSFGGRFLPATRTIDAKGFSASWQVSALATAAPQQLLAGGSACTIGANSDSTYAVAAVEPARRPASCIETFGVSFIDPVSAYTLSDRATKYGLLFVALTFVGVGLVEVMRRLRVHPVQYLLVGSAVAMFFLLLVSLTEHIAFAWAYLAASAACTLLLTFYGSFVLRGWKPGLVFGAAVGALYGALFTLLQLEQSALVLGSLLLFVVLAAVMVATRRVDWYTLIDNLRREPVPVAATPPQ